jgi:hypothetical protein
MPEFQVRGKTVTLPDNFTEDQVQTVLANLESMPEQELEDWTTKLAPTYLPNPTPERKLSRRQQRDAEPFNLDYWTMKELRAYAKGRHIPEYWRLTKQQLLTYLKNSTH